MITTAQEHPDDKLAKMMMGATYYKGNKHNEAVEVFKEVLTLSKLDTETKAKVRQRARTSVSRQPTIVNTPLSVLIWSLPPTDQ